MHHHVPTLVVYVLGVLGIAYHLANGLQTFAMGWGIVTSRRALKKLDVVVIARLPRPSRDGLGRRVRALGRGRLPSGAARPFRTDAVETTG